MAPSSLTTFKVDSSGDGNGSGTFADTTIPAGGFFAVDAVDFEANGGLGAGYVSNPVKLGST